MPVLVVAVVVASAFGGALLFVGGFDGLLFGGLGAVILVVVLSVAVAYVVGLSMLGGWIGNYLAVETDI